jgi:glycine cleavage system transcriptional repressor
VSQFAVSAIGRDRPGIVAAIAKGLLAVDGNVEDSRMTILGGHFAVMLIVSAPDDQSRNAIEASLAQSAEGLGLEAITVSEVSEAEAGRGADHVITVYGSDHPGIVDAVSAELAAASVNITDLQTRLAGGPSAPVYVMMIEVDLGEVARAELDERLRRVAESAAVEVELRPLDADAL